VALFHGMASPEVYLQATQAWEIASSSPAHPAPGLMSADIAAAVACVVSIALLLAEQGAVAGWPISTVSN